jgi:hypothetical protein
MAAEGRDAPRATRNARAARRLTGVAGRVMMSGEPEG